MPPRRRLQPPPDVAPAECSSGDSCECTRWKSPGTLGLGRLPTRSAVTAKPDKFNGDIPWSSCLAQFEAVAGANEWSDEQKACHLVSPLRGSALSVLQALPDPERRSFTHLTAALEKVRVVFADCAQDVVDTVAVGYFIDATAHVDVQQAVRLSGPTGLRAALTRALGVDTAKRTARTTQGLSRPVLGEARALAPVSDDDSPTCETASVQELRTVAGDAIPVEGVAAVSLTIAGQESRHAIYVADIVDQCILGFDFMKDHQCILDLREGTPHLGTRQLVLSSCTTTAPDPNPYVLCRRTVMVPPYAEVIVPGTAPSEQLCKVSVVEQCLEGPPTAGIIVARSLVRHAHPLVPIRILNVTPSPIVLQRGQRLARCSQVVEIHPTTGEDSAADPSACGDSCLASYIDELVNSTEPVLSQSHKQKIRSLFLEFHDVFSFAAADLGRTTAA
ncbi:uncharacterized protein LOC135388254 [Ornithodoros turicata]|uniref:uncharacterized protein LOC135388254 n=1 Tax=Ornithodoros turicata TaxID=34597 RepID=UPI003138B8B0